MQRKQNAITNLLRVGVFAAVALGTVAVMAADANGTWKWNAPAGGGRRGGGGPGGPGGAAPADPNAAPPAGPEITLKLKVEGSKLTGSLTRPGRGGGDPTVTDISNGKVDGDKVSFDLVQDFNGNSFTNSYEGKVDGDTIKGTQPGNRGGGRGRRGGGGPGGPGAAPADPAAPAAPPAPPARADWTATRVK